MTIFLLVLKILGITILSIIALVLLILALVLFVPVRYKLNGSYENEPDAQAKITWLLHLISLKVAYTKEGLTKTLRILGIPIKKREKKPKKPKKPKKEKPQNRLPQEEELTLEGFEEEKPVQTEEVPEQEAQKQYNGSSAQEEEERGFFSKLKEFIQKICDWVMHFSDKIRRIGQKIRSAAQNAEYYLDLLTDPKNQEILLYALSQVCKILKSISPKKWEINARFGFEEPDVTGKILAITSILYPFIGGHVYLDPVYDEKIIQASGYAKGRIFLITVLIVAWKLYFNKDLKKVIRKLKKEA